MRYWTREDRRRMRLVHPDLVIVLTGAQQRLPDWLGLMVDTGLRSFELQRAAYRSGTSQVTQGKHQMQPDGMVHAIDCPAVIIAANGEEQTSWDWEHYWIIGEAVRDECIETGIELVWGAFWQVINHVTDLRAEQQRYVARKKRERKRPLLDGPHFEIPDERYTA